jgi:hypothetical protein
VSDETIRRLLRDAEADPSPAANAAAAARRRRSTTSQDAVPDWMLNPVGWVFYFAFKSGSMAAYRYFDTRNKPMRQFVGHANYDIETIYGMSGTPIWFPAEPHELYWGYKKPSERTSNMYSFDIGPKSLEGLAQRFLVTPQSIYLANRDFLDDLARSYPDKYLIDFGTHTVFDYSRALPDWLKNRSIWIPPHRPYTVLFTMHNMAPGSGGSAGLPLKIDDIVEARLLTRKKTTQGGSELSKDRWT